MTWLTGVLVLVGLLGLAALAYWQLIIAEGAYLGPRVVAWTYDLVARRYDAVKRFDPRNESWFVAAPVLRGMLEVKRPLLLDVATGTGRVPLALLRSHFRGQIVGLDLSRGMLRQARAKLQDYGDQVIWLWQDASHLPFSDGTFDAVTCLEALEFLPRPPEALAEMVRVLAPGGMLFLTNRVGVEAPLLPGRAIPRPQFEQLLSKFPLREIEVRPWQVTYDLATARREGVRGQGERGNGDAMALIRCVHCGGELQPGVAGLSCPACKRRYPIRERIVHLAGPGERSAA